MTPGLVSTIIPVFNRPRQLIEAVGSVLAQDYRPLEIVVVDDGSTDETPAVAGQLAGGHPEIHVIHQPNGGPGRAREAGRRQASGEFIQYLDSDDLLLPGKFSAQVAGLRARPEVGASYGWTRHRSACGEVTPGPWKGSGVAREAMFPSFLQSRWWDTPTPLYRRSACDAAGPWTDLWLEEDWEYDCRVAALGTRLHYHPAFVAEVREQAVGRLSGQPHDTQRLAQRARSHELILAHALRAGLGPATAEMQHFTRELFLLARQCGAAGLPTASARLCELALHASGDQGGALDLRLYRGVASVLGWGVTGKLACWSDRLRRQPVDSDLA